MTDVVAIILAAGEGKRLRSSNVKAVHRVGGIPIVSHVYRAAKAVGANRVIVVVGRDAELVKETLGPDCEYVEQLERLGTGHACQQAERLLEGFCGTVLVLMGDAPLITANTLSNMLTEHSKLVASATVLTARPANVRGRGRILRNDRGVFQKIVEERDATPAQKEIGEINAGFYSFDSAMLFAALKRINNHNDQGEYQLPDVLPILAENGTVHTVELADFSEALGIDDRVWLSEAEGALQKRIKERLMLAGVTFIDPTSTYVEADVSIAQDTIIYPFTTIRGTTSIGEGCVIGPGTTLVDSMVGEGATIVHSVVEASTVERGCHIGPFAHLRPDSVIKENVKIGNFVEVKKSTIGQGTKIKHLTFIGDARVGCDVNIGAGVIVVNYDGKNKHTTVIEDESFVGCNANLVAPVTVGKGAYVAAGSTITKDIPASALAIARSRQENKEGWVTRKKDS